MHPDVIPARPDLVERRDGRAEWADARSRGPVQCSDAHGLNSARVLARFLPRFFASQTHRLSNTGYDVLENELFPAGYRDWARNTIGGVYGRFVMVVVVVVV